MAWTVVGSSFQKYVRLKRGVEVGMCVLAQTVMGFAIGDHSEI